MPIWKRDEFNKYLSRLEGTCLPEMLTIYAPTCYGECIDAVLELREKIDRITGGSTTYQAEGCFIMNGEDVCEPVMVIETAHQCFGKDEANEVGKAITEYGKKANQEYIAVKQGKFYIVKTEEMAKQIEGKIKL